MDTDSIELLQGLILKGDLHHQIVRDDGDEPVWPRELTSNIMKARLLETAEMLTPPWIMGAPGFTRLDSFAEYINAFNTNSTTVFVNDLDGHMLAELEYHENASTPGGRHHKAILKPRTTSRWDEWSAKKDITLDPRAFVEFIEDRAPDITSPPPAKLMAMFGRLKVIKKANVEITDHGSVVTAVDNVDTAVPDVTLPPSFVVQVPMFRGEDVLEFKVRVRAIAPDDVSPALRIKMQISNYDLVVEGAIDSLIKRLGSLVGDIPVYYGNS